MESQLSVLATEWREVQQREIDNWERHLKSAKSEYLHLREEGRWVGGPTDYLSVIHRSRSELDHSALIGWLFDPCMHHGLGPVFLQSFLKQCFGREFTGLLHNARVELEVTRDDCRVDIVVWGETFTLIVENKVDAPEAAGQCDAYYKLFSDEPNARFVFLTPTGGEPMSASGDAAGAFQPLSYAKVAEALEDSLSQTADASPGRGREIAESYLETLRKEFS